MFCSQCGAEISDSAKYCSNCGALNSQSTDQFEKNGIQIKEPGRGTLILLLGFFSFFLGPFLGIPAWVMGHTDLKKIRYGIIALSEKTKTKIGMILGIFNTLILPFVIIFGIATVVGINVFTASSTQANRDALVSDLTNLAAMAQQYHRKPSSLGGGGGTYDNWTIPQGLQKTANGKYYIEKLNSQSITLVGQGYEIGDDGINPTKVRMEIKPSVQNQNTQSIRSSSPNIETTIVN